MEKKHIFINDNDSLVFAVIVAYILQVRVSLYGLFYFSQSLLIREKSVLWKIQTCFFPLSSLAVTHSKIPAVFMLLVQHSMLAPKTEANLSRSSMKSMTTNADLASCPAVSCCSLQQSCREHHNRSLLCDCWLFSAVRCSVIEQTNPDSIVSELMDVGTDTTKKYFKILPFT